jgi:hypothetical protein
MQVLRDSIGQRKILQMIETCHLSTFTSAYASLATLLARFRRPSTLNTKLVFQTPPQQQTVPSDPAFTGGSQASKKSSSSTESKPEPYGHEFVNDFLRATCTTVVGWLEDLPWVKPVAKLYLNKQFASTFMQC